MLVHAPQNPPIKITEESPRKASWEYPKSKILTEDLLVQKHGNIPLVILRIAGCYDDDCHSIPISNQIERIYDRSFERFLFPGDITHGASFLHLEDLADVIFEAIQKRKDLPKEFIALVGEEEVLSYDYLQRNINKQLFGKELKTMRVPKWFAKFGAWIQCHIPGYKSFIRPWMIDLADDNYDIDISRIKKALQWKPKRSLRSSLRVMIESLQKDPERWFKLNGLKYKG
jgi:nucleoside-diphosphate-sugar epimerase